MSVLLKYDYDPEVLITGLSVGSAPSHNKSGRESAPAIRHHHTPALYSHGSGLLTMATGISEGLCLHYL
jgi:hypothetical protein